MKIQNITVTLLIVGPHNSYIQIIYFGNCGNHIWLKYKEIVLIL